MTSALMIEEVSTAMTHHPLTERDLAKFFDDVAKIRALTKPSELAKFLNDLARVREERYEKRRARLESSPWRDPRQVALFLDRRIVTTQEAADELGVGASRVSELRGGRKVGRGGKRIDPKSGPHPAVFPYPDTIEGWVAAVPSFGLEIGRLREWAEEAGNRRLDLDTGELVRIAPSHGAPATPRPAQELPTIKQTRRQHSA